MFHRYGYWLGKFSVMFVVFSGKASVRQQEMIVDQNGRSGLWLEYAFHAEPLSEVKILSLF